jgi:hypothetical protein
MAKIAEVIKLRSGYANFVELKSSFEEAQENAERMAMYRPTKAHRQAFERIVRGVYQPTDKKFYLLSGSYGTGKSHLCLMTANFLSRSSGDPQISGFYENYARLDADKAQMLKNIRKDGQYLVAICDYHSGGKFEDVVLRALRHVPPAGWMAESRRSLTRRNGNWWIGRKKAAKAFATSTTTSVRLLKSWRRACRWCT